MIVLQQNCGEGYESTISALEAGLGLNAAIVCIQEPFLRNRSIAHAGFNFYWPSGISNRKDMLMYTTGMGEGEMKNRLTDLLTDS